MTIRSADRDVIRRQVEIGRDRKGWHFKCTEGGCSFRRDYETEQGAVNGVAAHVRAHGMRVRLEGDKPASRLDEFLAGRARA